MLYSESSPIFGKVAEIRQKRIGEAVGYLQGDSEQHGENEEHGHLSLSEQGKCPEPHGVHQRLLLSRPVHGALRQCQRIQGQDDA